MSVKETVVQETIKALPSGTTLTLTLFGYPISQWAAVLSCVVLLTQFVFMVINQVRRADGNKAQRD